MRVLGDNTKNEGKKTQKKAQKKSIVVKKNNNALINHLYSHLGK